jgi:hypothetical protein
LQSRVRVSRCLLAERQAWPPWRWASLIRRRAYDSWSRVIKSVVIAATYPRKQYHQLVSDVTSLRRGRAAPPPPSAIPYHVPIQILISNTLPQYQLHYCQTRLPSKGDVGFLQLLSYGSNESIPNSFITPFSSMSQIVCTRTNFFTQQRQ